MKNHSLISRAAQLLAAVVMLESQHVVAGYVRFNVSGTDAAYGVTLQADGKIVVVGDGGGDFAIARLTSGGAMDATFSPGGLDGDGVFRFNINGTDAAHGVAIQSDGKIVVVGKAGDDFAVARLTAVGVLDSTFSPGGLDGDGVVRFNISGVDAAYGVALQADGKIVVVGEAGGDFTVARLTSAGELDSMFNPVGLDGDGVFRFNISGSDAAYGVAIQADGKIVVAGKAGDDFAVARLTTTGALDVTFSPGGLDGDGVARFNISGTDAAYGVAIQSDGKIVVVGDAGGDFAVARLTSAGALDSTFSPGGLDGDGVFRFNISGTDGAYGVAIQSDGKIVVVGNGGDDYAVARLTTTGVLDPTFSPGGLDGDGVIRFNISGTEAARAVALQSDGKIVVVGNGGDDFAVSRITADGEDDPTFPGPEFTVSPAIQTVSPSGGSYSFNVTATNDWTWSLSGGSGWVTSSEATSQSGNQTFTYTVAAYNGIDRSATITLVSGAFTVTHMIGQYGSESPPGCSLPNGGLGNVNVGGINFGLSQAHIGDSVAVFPTLGMVSNACRAIKATGSIWIATGRLINFLDNAILDPGNLISCPANGLCQPGPYNILITPGLIGAGVTSPQGSVLGVPKTVRAVENGDGTVLNGVNDQIGDFHGASIQIVTPCIQVVQLCAYPSGMSCFPAGVGIDFTGYVTNCGDIRLANVTLVHSRTAMLLTTNGQPLVQPLALNVGQAVGFRGSFTPTSAETCAGSAASTTTARGTDITLIGGPNASVTNSVTGSCNICPVVCGPALMNPTITSGQFSLSFVTTPGRTNIVEYTDSLSPLNWQSRSNFLGDGSVKIIADPLSNKSRFYRVVVQ